MILWYTRGSRLVNHSKYHTGSVMRTYVLRISLGVIHLAFSSREDVENAVRPSRSDIYTTARATGVNPGTAAKLHNLCDSGHSQSAIGGKVARFRSRCVTSSWLVLGDRRDRRVSEKLTTRLYCYD